MSKIEPNFPLIAKPSGSICNFDYTYRFYLEKSKPYPNRKTQWQMRDDILEQYGHTNIEPQLADIIDFIWQGEKPTRLRLGFYKLHLSHSLE